MRLAAIVLMLVPSISWGAQVTIDVPDAFANSARATALCEFFANKYTVDSQPSRKLCLEEIVRVALIELAIEKKAADRLSETRQLEQQEAIDIRDQWDTVLDLPVCGDSELDAGEECDDGSGNSDTVADACRLGCANAFCGDGVVDTGETCDGTGCLPDCSGTDPNSP
jgi:hypothetical protein